MAAKIIPPERGTGIVDQNGVPYLRTARYFEAMSTAVGIAYYGSADGSLDFTVSSAAGILVLEGATIIIFQSGDNKFYASPKIAYTITPATITDETITISGLTFGDAFDQVILCKQTELALVKLQPCYAVKDTGTIYVDQPETGDTYSFNVSGDYLSLKEKPDWVT